MKLVTDPDPKRVSEDAMRLPLEARAALAAALLRSLDGPADAGAEEAWRREIARRIRESDVGTSKSIPWAEAEGLIFDR
jgi:putative addiction module component (TIGR02574 family)